MPWRSPAAWVWSFACFSPWHATLSAESQLALPLPGGRSIDRGGRLLRRLRRGRRSHRSASATTSLHCCDRDAEHVERAAGKFAELFRASDKCVEHERYVEREWDRRRERCCRNDFF